jgi:ATP-dependent phosphofructokinase / diphosphate-dependent phosphofructokinase
VLLPEVPFDEAPFLEKVRETVAAHKCCVVVVGEGLKDTAGKEIGADFTRLDAFGHPLLSGASDSLAEIIYGKLNAKTRTVKLGYAHIEEAVLCGEAAVRAAVDGRSGFMVKLVRTSNDPYHCTTELQDLTDIANAVHLVPRDWITPDGFLPNEQFIQYARPLIEGETKLAWENGLPRFATLSRTPVDKVLPARS